MNLDLKLADGAVVTFDNTGRLVDFLYAVAVQRGKRPARTVSVRLRCRLATALAWVLGSFSRAAVRRCG